MLLLSDGKPLTPEGSAHALWGVDAPSSAAATVRTYIHRLRRVFGDYSTKMSTDGRMPAHTRSTSCTT